MTDWPRHAPAAAGLRAEVLEAASAYLETLPGANVHAILVARHGRLAFERYWSGADEVWGSPAGITEHGPESRHDLRSVTKSVVGLLAGIALDRGLDLDTPVVACLPELADLGSGGRERITLRHLLTMTAGLDWNEYGPKTADNPELRMLRAPDPLRFVFDRPLAAEPGALWTYNGGCTELLGAALARAAGTALDTFAGEALFGPLGIADAEWSRMPGSGLPAASSGLRLAPRDLLKLGQLVLERGAWRGRRVVPEAWVHAATTPQAAPPDRLFYYGYQWWLGRSLLRGRELPWTSAQGLGGQALFVVPALDLAVAITAGLYGDPMQVWLPLVILNRFVLAAIA